MKRLLLIIMNIIFIYTFTSNLYSQNYYILLDAGHGGSDNGATGYSGVYEKNLTLDYSNNAFTKIENDLSHLWVSYRSRNSDEFLSLQDRYDMANNASGVEVDADNYPIPEGGVDAFWSIHCNAFDGTATGTEVYYYKSGDWPSNRETKSINSATVALQYYLNETKKVFSNAHSRWVKNEPFSVLKNSNMPAILIETEFIDNETSCSNMTTQNYKDKVGDGLNNAISCLNPTLNEFIDFVITSDANSWLYLGSEYLLYRNTTPHGTKNTPSPPASLTYIESGLLDVSSYATVIVDDNVNIYPSGSSNIYLDDNATVILGQDASFNTEPTGIYPPPPGAPTAPVLINCQYKHDNSSIKLKWQEAPQGISANFFRIYRCLNSEAMQNDDVIGISNEWVYESGEWYIVYYDSDINLIPGVQYKYAVAGVNSIGEGYNSNEISETFGSLLSSNIGSNTTISGTYYSNGTTISNNSTVTILADARISINSSSSIIVNSGSKIIANGTESNPIKFIRRDFSQAWDRIQLFGDNNEFEWCIFDGGTCNIDIRSSNNSFSYCTSMNSNRGIYFYNGATGTVSNSEISDNNYGIYLYKSAPTIQNCEIDNCNTAGIYLSDNNYISGDADIINNSIHDHDIYGIFCYKSSPEIRENTIETCYKGVYCTNSSSPVFGEYHVRGNNIISDCYTGLIANYDSDPFLGIMNPDVGGWNQFINDHSFISAYNYSNVYAEQNWWGSSPPDHSKFSSDYYSSIYYDPWLTSAPSQQKSSSSKNDISSFDYNSGYDENWPLKIKIDYARSLIYLDNPAESKKICADIIDLNPDSSLSFLALNVYWAADRYQSEKGKTGQKDFQNLLIDLSAKKYKCELYGYSELLLADSEGDKGLSRIDKVYNEYKDSFLPEAALYQKFLYYLDEKDDLSSALVVNEQLNDEYPNSSFTEWSNEHLSKESSANEKLSKSANIQEASSIPTKYEISQNYPNPFNPYTRIKYALPNPSFVDIAVYNSIGQKIKSFNQLQKAEGYHFITWDGTNNNGVNVPSGLYILKFSAQSIEAVKSNYIKSIKMLLIR